MSSLGLVGLGHTSLGAEVLRSSWRFQGLGVGSQALRFKPAKFSDLRDMPHHELHGALAGVLLGPAMT